VSSPARPLSEQPVTRAVEPSFWASVSFSKALSKVVIYVLLFVLTVLFMGPFAFAVTTSLKAPYEIFVFPPKWIPEVWRFSNYYDAMTQAPFDLFFTNTLIITALAMSGQITSSALVAYGFARFQFPGRNFLFILVIGTLILPEEVTIISTFLMFRRIGWLDTWYPLIVPAFFGGGAFSIFLFRQFFLSLPKDMDEAAELDGASSLRILWSIILPLSKPAIATLAIFAFLGRWNDFFHPLIYLNTTEKFTVSLGLRFYQQTVGYGGEAREHLLMAAAITATLPVVVVFFIFQRQFVRGIVLSGIKG
jgi:multiple sugar transport system permease protein